MRILLELLMPRLAFVIWLSWVPAIATLLHLYPGEAAAQTVWSGYAHSFTKPASTDPNDPENQDRITDNVWVTRASTGGIYNISQETFYDFSSPADTEWATDLNNPGDTIAATNWANLDFASWIDAYGGSGGGTLPARLIGRNAVVHMISDNIYIDLRFTDWTAGGGGGFSYLRAVPEPATHALVLCAVLAFPARRNHRKT
jgi:hypothetical protein